MIAMDDPVTRAHAGQYEYHDDDCRCSMADLFCNRDGQVWSCCGACKEHSDCSAPNTHPTYWQHPLHGAMIAEFAGVRPTYRTNAEIRALATDCFQD